MRQSPIIQWAIDNQLDLEICLDLCDIFASVTHHHPDTYPAIRSHAELLFNILNNEFDFNDVKKYILNSNYKPLTIDYWKEQKAFIWDAPKSLSIVYCAIINATNFKHFIDNCIEITGDVDTYCAIGGPIAQSLWEIPSDYLILTNSILNQDKYLPAKLILI